MERAAINLNAAFKIEQQYQMRCAPILDLKDDVIVLTVRAAIDKVEVAVLAARLNKIRCVIHCTIEQACSVDYVASRIALECK